MRRRWIVMLAGMSLGICLATAALWVRSHRVRDGAWYTTDAMRYSLHSYRGRVWLWTLSTAPPRVTWTIWPSSARPGPGLVWDSTPDSWYDQFAANPKAAGLTDVMLDVPASGATVRNDGFLGFRYVRTNTWVPLAQLPMGYPTEQSTALYIPHWAIVLATALLPAAVVARSLRSRSRRAHGLCPNCGYDLRASGETCPECGTATART